ncbi:MAG: HPr family phosphocarrier protein [Planctomycetes bacterium]|nr:HPr family phosphocarrier protein [Planctomycetota bacterium]
MSESSCEAVREATITHPQGLHARPVMRFIDVASKFQSSVTVTNISRSSESVDGKSAMHMMLLEATMGSVLRVHARGVDAREAVDALASLVEQSFGLNPTPPTD